MAHYLCDVFVDVAEAKRLGVSLDEITSPYDAWNKLPNASFVFKLSTDPKELAKTRDSPLYKRLSSYPKKYVQLHLVLRT